MSTVILTVSILLQFTAALLALLLIRASGRVAAWVLIAAAMVFMGIRRSITLYHHLAGDAGPPPDLSAELVALAISVFLVAGMAGIGPLFRRITQFQEQSARNEQRLRGAVESLEEGFALFDADDRLVISNDEYARLHPATRDLIRPGARFEDLVRKEAESDLIAGIAGREAEFIRTRLEQHRTPHGPVIRQLTDGTWCILRDVKTPDGGTAITYVDITELKRSNQKTERFGRIVDQSSNEIYVFAADTLHFILVNEGARRNLGYSMEELRHMQPWHLKPEFTRRRFESLIEPLRKGLSSQLTMETTYRRKNGSDYPVEVKLQLFHSENPPVFLAMAMDITERKQGNDALLVAQGELEKRVEEKTRDLRRQIIERKFAEEALLEAVQEADRANKIKSEFLANMSHELRTPLNAIIGFSGAMKEQLFGPLPNDKYQEYIDNIYESGELLLELINDILDVSAIEAGKLEFHEEAVNMALLAEQAERLVKGLAGKGRVRLSNNIDDTLPRVHGDERRLKQIFLNLLTNAIKFTPENGEVTLDARLDRDGSLVFTVTDTGIGMNEEGVARAMEPFGQVETSMSPKYEGTGLGLPVTKGLAEAHGGSLEISSEPGRGTTVTVRLPAGRVMTGPAPVGEIRQGDSHSEGG